VLSVLQLEVGAQPDRVQLADQLRPRCGRGAEPAGTALVGRRAVRDHHRGILRPSRVLAPVVRSVLLGISGLAAS